MRLIPAWAALLILQIAAFLLQFFCARYFEIGLLFLWIAMVPYWPIVLFNLSGLLIVKDVFQNKLAKPFLLIPLIWFGGYATATIVSHVQANRIQRELEAFNDGKSIRWKPETLPLRIDDSDVSRRGSESVPMSLIWNYGLNEVFLRSIEYNGGKRQWASNRRIWLAQQSCPTVPDNEVAGIGLRGQDQWAQVTYQSGKKRWQTSLLSGLCMWSGPYDPQQSPLVVRLGRSADIRANLGNFVTVKGFRQAIQVMHPDGQRLELTTGAVTPLAWLPSVLWGCGFQFGSNKWKLGETCRFDFWAGGEFSRAVARDKPEAVIARALGLKEISLPDRFPDSKAKT